MPIPTAHNLSRTGRSIVDLRNSLLGCDIPSFSCTLHPPAASQCLLPTPRSSTVASAEIELELVIICS